jgi:hypothetical protein
VFQGGHKQTEIVSHYHNTSDNSTGTLLGTNSVPKFWSRILALSVVTVITLERRWATSNRKSGGGEGGEQKPKSENR